MGVTLRIVVQGFTSVGGSSQQGTVYVPSAFSSNSRLSLQNTK